MASYKTSRHLWWLDKPLTWFYYYITVWNCHIWIIHYYVHRRTCCSFNNFSLPARSLFLPGLSKKYVIDFGTASWLGWFCTHLMHYTACHDLFNFGTVILLTLSACTNISYGSRSVCVCRYLCVSYHTSWYIPRLGHDLLSTCFLSP